jgi:hypothetical protein
MEFLRNDHNWIFGCTGQTDPIIINSGLWSHQRKYREFSTIDVFLISFLAPRPSLDSRLTTYIYVLHLSRVVYHFVTPHRSSHRSKISANPITSGWYAIAVAPWWPSIKGEYRSSFSTTSEPDLHSSFKPPSPSFSSHCSFSAHANYLHLRHSALKGPQEESNPMWPTMDRFLEMFDSVGWTVAGLYVCLCSSSWWF